MNDPVNPDGTRLPDGKPVTSASLQTDNQKTTSSPKQASGLADDQEKPRRRSRGGRGRRRSSTEESETPSASLSERVSEAASDATESAPRKKARRTRGGAGRSRTTKNEADSSALDSESNEPLAEPRADSGEQDRDYVGAEKPKRKRSRGTRGRRSKAADSGEASAASTGESTEREPRDEDDRDATEEAASAGPKPRKSRTRRKVLTRRKRVSVSEENEEERTESDDHAYEAEQSSDEDAEGGELKKRRRRGSRGGRRRKKVVVVQHGVVESIPGEENELLDLEEFDLNSAGASSGREPKARTSRGKQTPEESIAQRTRVSEEKAAALEAARTQTILVNADHHEEVRVAVCEGERILDFQMVVDRYTSLVNDIYRGRVVNIEAPIGAAFIDFGQGKNGFLHASDVLSVYGEADWNLDKLLTTRVEDDDWGGGGDSVDSSDEGKGSSKNSKSRGKRGAPRRSSRPRMAITDLFKKGQMVAAQITKDAIGDKGPTLTTYISIPGRYLVLMPSLARTGVSRKIEDEKERRRLKRILTSLKIQEGMGVIVRTAGIGKTKAELRRDLDYLMAVWEDFGKRLVSGRNPAPLYEESSVAIRTMRDLFNAKTKAVIVDDPTVHTSMVEFAEALMPEHVDRIKLHEGTRPLFHAHGIEQEFERMFSRRIELPSGGSIVFDQTEALVAIDVNSGRTREGSGFEDVALKANMEAAPEIARQIRLRDLGGILVVDFIDMMRSSSRLAVEREFRNALAGDRARSKVGRISQFGLLEMTRQRLGPGLSKLIFDPCNVCRGSGRERTASSRAQAILRRLGSAMTQKGFSTIEVRAHPEVVDYLQTKAIVDLNALKSRHSRELKFSGVPDQVEDSVLRYLRTDGREVRPGGRRKR